MRAFTLFEILIVIAILSLITGGSIMVLNSGDAAFTTDMSLLDLQQQARQSLNKMITEVRSASSLTIPAALPAPQGNASISFTTPAGNIQYYRNLNNQIIREFPAGTQQVFGNYITNLSFCCVGGANCNTCVGSSLLVVNLTVSNTVRGRLLSFTLRGQARLRNE